MKFGHGTCFRSAPNLSWHWHNKRHMLPFSPPLSVLLFIELFCQRCLSLLKANSFGISYTHLASPMSCEPLAARYERVSTAFPLCQSPARLAELCGPRLCTLLHTPLFPGSHQTAASSCRDQQRLQLQGQTQGPLFIGLPFACHCATPSVT